jgi:hypothetical protein
MVARVAAPAVGRARRVRRPLVVGLGVVALLAFLTAGLLLVLGGGRATAQTDSGPKPYGGQLEKADVDTVATAEQVLEVGMLTVGTVNGLAFAVATIVSRGPSTAQTRRALTERTGAGVVSESRRERRDRERSRSVPEPEVAGTGVPSPVLPMAVVPAPEPAGPRPGGPRTLAPRTPPPGAVPVQGGPVPRERLVPAGRAPLRPRGPAGPPGHPSSPPAGGPAVHPGARR